MTMPITFVSDCSIQTYTEAKEREHSRKHKQATCVPITLIDGAKINLIKTPENTDGEYLEEMKAFKRIDLTPVISKDTHQRGTQQKTKSWENN